MVQEVASLAKADGRSSPPHESLLESDKRPAALLVVAIWIGQSAKNGAPMYATISFGWLPGIQTEDRVLSRKPGPLGRSQSIDLEEGEGMNTRLLAAALLASIAPFFAIAATTPEDAAKPSQITTDAQAAGSVHVAFEIQASVYLNTTVITGQAELIALQLLNPSSPALSLSPGRLGKSKHPISAPKMGAALANALDEATSSRSDASASPIVTPCPAGGSVTLQWSRGGRDDSLGEGVLTLLAEYRECREELGPQTIQVDNGPIAVRVRLAPPRPPTILSVRHGSSASDSTPARDYTREFIQRVPEGDVLDVRATSNHEVSGRFMQVIGPSGTFEGEFSYTVNGKFREEQFVSFPEVGLGVIERAKIAEKLVVSGSQGLRSGEDGMFQTEDDTFDIGLHYASGTLISAYHDPFVGGEMPIRFTDLRLADRQPLVSGVHRITMDGTVSLAYPAFWPPTCFGGTFRYTTRETIVNQLGPAQPPSLTQGILEIGRDVLAVFNADGSIDVSLGGNAPVNYGNWPTLESAIPCFFFIAA